MKSNTMQEAARDAVSDLRKMDLPHSVIVANVVARLRVASQLGGFECDEPAFKAEAESILSTFPPELPKLIPDAPAPYDP